MTRAGSSFLLLGRLRKVPLPKTLQRYGRWIARSMPKNL